MWTIFGKEVHSFLDSLMAYVVVLAFLTSLGLLLWFFPESSLLTYGYANMDSFFGLCPYVMIFLVPAISMRSYAEERRLRTLELLLTAPVSISELVLAKFLACCTLIGACLLPSITYYFSLYFLGNPVGNIDSAKVVGGYLGLLLLSASFCAVGQCSSALCRNQLAAFVIASFVCFMAYFGLSTLSSLDLWGWKGRYAELLSLSYHYDVLGKGLIDLKEIVFFTGFTGFFLLLTGQVIKHQR